MPGALRRRRFPAADAGLGLLFGNLRDEEGDILHSLGLFGTKPFSVPTADKVRELLRGSEQSARCSRRGRPER
jgi:hypothetical protein